jgi:hypothetical protein
MSSIVGQNSQMVLVTPGDHCPEEESAATTAAAESTSPVRLTLRPIMLPELRADTDAADRSVLRHRDVLMTLSNAVPRRLSGEVGAVWHLLFSTAMDGTSLAHMLRTVASDASLLLVIRSAERVWGAFIPELRDHSDEHGAFYGNGESFLWALAELCLPPPPEKQLSSPSPSGGARSSTKSVFAYTYKWSHGANDHFVRSDDTGLFIGAGGSGGVGLRLDADLSSGLSGACETYGNDVPLSTIATPLTTVCGSERHHSRASSSSSEACEAAGHAEEPSSPSSSAGLLPVTPDPAASPSVSSMGRAKSAMTGATPALGDADDCGRAVRFAIDLLEVWALDEHACRGMEACSSHVAVPMHWKYL